MKIIYSQLKQFLPDLKKDAKTIANDLTWIGHFCDGFEEKDGEEIISLEIRSNRGDCLGYLGIARELSILYDIPLNLNPSIPATAETSPLNKGDLKLLPIKILSPDVKRVQAIKIKNINIDKSNDKIKKFLELHEINSINNIVDFTNYIMFLYGIPCHAFDADKVHNDQLIWQNITKNTPFTTLDGTQLNLHPNTLVITDKNQIPLCLSFIGGQNSAVTQNTKNIILEMAIYNHSRVRVDSRQLKTTTEASIRLDKELDSSLVPTAFNHLIQLILNDTNGNIDSNLFDSYPQKPQKKNIVLNIDPSDIAGIKIPNDFTQKIISKINIDSRPDIESEIDLVEEAIRFYGFQKIPTDQPINSKIISDITPQVLKNIETLKSELITKGFSEVRTKPLTNKKYDNSIMTQNSINSEYPYLRTNLTDSLKEQIDIYNRFKIPLTPIFEIGKIFYKENDKYIEKYALCTFGPPSCHCEERRDEAIPWEFHESIIDNSVKEYQKLPDIFFNAYEITSQIICLDANLISQKSEKELIAFYKKEIGDILWNISVIDHYQNKYTFRVWYFNCDDKFAKQIHLKVFNLN
jgi:phenylalanyl-tRNA synthetase beta chain